MFTTRKAKDELDNYMTTKAASKNNIPVFEIVAQGRVDAPNNVRVNMERFGSERQTDSMFENYDDKCSTRIRRSWRCIKVQSFDIVRCNNCTELQENLQ